MFRSARRAFSFQFRGNADKGETIRMGGSSCCRGAGRGFTQKRKEVPKEARYKKKIQQQNVCTCADAPYSFRPRHHIRYEKTKRKSSVNNLYNVQGRTGWLQGKDLDSVCSGQGPKPMTSPSLTYESYFSLFDRRHKVYLCERPAVLLSGLSTLHLQAAASSLLLVSYFRGTRHRGKI